MGHIHSSARDYRMLSQRFADNITGASNNQVFMDILKLLYNEDDARIASRLPLRPRRLETVAEWLQMSAAELNRRIDDMAARGLVFDFVNGSDRYIALPPVIIGFFEFVYMRSRDDFPMQQLSRLFEEYMFGEKSFAEQAFTGQTQISRMLAREDTIPTDDISIVLDYEKASSIINDSASFAVSTCSCRHHSLHLDKACSAPLRTCLSFGRSADTLSSHRLAERIEKNEAMDILSACKDANLCQIADNVQSEVSFICNCCGCCCGFLRGIKTFDIRNGVMASQWTASIDSSACNGCGRCSRLCPLEAVYMESGESKEKKAHLDATLCLGCGICQHNCPQNAITMTARQKRIITPANFFDRYMNMLVERGKLSGFLFDNPENMSHRVLGGIAKAIENSSPARGLIAVQPLRSIFLSVLIGAGKKFTGL